MILAFICIVAFAVSILTFFSGFGLGTILTPVFMIFFPADLAIALTAVVHFLNNIFKVFLVGRYVNKEVILRFGLPAVLASFIGAWLLLQIPVAKPLYQYNLLGHHFEVYLVKLIIALLLIFFALMDILPVFKKIQFDKNKMPMGGLLSGFFGGLSGNQGALRAVFLIKAGLSKQAYVATAVALSLMVDTTRLGVYATRFTQAGLIDNVPLVAGATASAMAGAYFGNRLLKKITIHRLQLLVAALLIVLSLALALGWL